MTKFKKGLLVLSLAIMVSCSVDKKTEESKGVVKNEIIMIQNPASENTMQPYLFSNVKEVLMSWTHKKNDTVNSVLFSTFKDGKWEEAKEIVNGKDWFINWADFPAIAKNGENIMSHFLQKSDPATFAYNVHLTQSIDNGNNWSKDFKLHKDSTLTEHGFVSMLPINDGAFFITWLDGRNTGGGGHGDSNKKEEHTSGATQTNDDGHKNKQAMNVRAAIVLPNGEVIEDTLVDDKTCDCCQTTAAITPNGPVIIYRDRTDEEVRDIYISRLVGSEWTEPKVIYNDHWVIKGCPVNGPKADSFKNTLAIAWFTAANNEPKVKLTFSDNNGETFDVPISISSGKPIGRVDMALMDENNALVSWMETTDNGGAEIKVMKVNKNGTKNKPVVVTKIGKSRASGFPQFEVIDNSVIFAWNNVVDKTSEVKTAIFPLELLN